MIDVVALVIGSATLVTIVPLLIGCVQWFHRFIGWKDGVEYQQDIESGLGSSQSLSHPDGTLHPPAESVDTDSIKGITFEPLPDIVGQQRSSDAKPDDPAITLVRAVENLRHGGAQYEVPRGHLFYVAEVGSGWFGQVLQGDGEKLRFGQPRTKVVVKMLRDEASLDEQLRFLQEVMLYRVLDHPNMLKFLGQCTDSLPYLTILEHAEFGDMKSYLMNNRENRESFIKRGNLLKFACEMAAGLACMHRHDFIHRDFAARNCLVTHELSVKVGDYGISEETYKEDYTEVDGTMVPLRWLAPETAITDGKLKVTGPTKKSNIWSFGVALWELFMLGERPYSNLADEAVITQVLIERFQQLPEPSTPVSWKSKVYDVMKLCWRDDRPGIEDVHNALKQLELAVTESFSADFDTKWNTLVKQRSRSGSELSSGSGPGGVVMNGSGPPTGVSQPVTLAGPHEMLVTADVLMEDEVQTGFPRPKLLTQLAVEQSEQSWTPSKATEKEFQMTSTPVTKPDTQTSSSYSTAQTSSNNPDMFSTAIDQTPQPVSEGLSLSQIEAEGMVSEDASPSDTSGETVSAPIKEDDQKVAELISLTTEDPIEVDEKRTDVFEIRENPEEILPAVGANIDNTAGANSSVIPDILENLDQQKSALDAQLEEPSVEPLTADGGEAAVIPQVESPSALDTALIPQAETPSVELDKEDTPEDNNQKADPSLDQGNLTGQPQTAS